MIETITVVVEVKPILEDGVEIVTKQEQVIINQIEKKMRQKLDDDMEKAMFGFYEEAQTISEDSWQNITPAFRIKDCV